MEKSFEVRDVVYLKSGSPAMTISKFTGEKTRAWCVWFDGVKNETKKFMIANLTKEPSKK